MGKFQVDIKIGNHSSKIPSGTEKLVEELLKNANCKAGRYEALLGAFIRGSNHQKGVKVARTTDTAVLLQVQAGDNGTNVEVHLHCPPEYKVQEWFDLLKSVEKIDNAKQSQRQKDLKKKLRKLCVLLNGQDTIFLDITEKIVQDIGYKDFNSFRASIYNRDNGCFEIQKAGPKTKLVWKESFLEEVRGLHPNLGQEPYEDEELPTTDFGEMPAELSIPDRISYSELAGRENLLWDVELLQDYILKILEKEDYSKEYIQQLVPQQEDLTALLATNEEEITAFETKIEKLRQKNTDIREGLTDLTVSIENTKIFLSDLAFHRENLELKLENLEEEKKRQEFTPEIQSLLDNMTAAFDGDREKAMKSIRDIVAPMEEEKN